MQRLSFIQELSLLVHTLTPEIVMWLVCAGVIATLLFTQRKREACIFFIALCATMLILVLAKTFFAVPRPENALVSIHSYAFPSAHATSSAFLATTLTWLFAINVPKKPFMKVLLLGTALFFFALVVGLSRIGIGVHTPFQVMGGFFLGVMVPLYIIVMANVR